MTIFECKKCGYLQSQPIQGMPNQKLSLNFCTAYQKQLDGIMFCNQKSKIIDAVFEEIVFDKTDNSTIKETAEKAVESEGDEKNDS